MEEIYEVFDSAEKISVYDDGQISEYNPNTEEYEVIISDWKNLIKDSRQMPALGVSLDYLTREEMKKGLWVEFDFGKLYEVNGMPFERLLIEVKSENYGFNIIRYTKEHGYDGRCFYLDLVNKNMSDFYDILLKM